MYKRIIIKLLCFFVILIGMSGIVGNAFAQTKKK